MQCAEHCIGLRWCLCGVGVRLGLVVVYSQDSLFSHYEKKRAFSMCYG